MAERYTVYSDVVSSTFKLYLEYELRDNGGKYYDIGVWDYGIIGTSSTYRAKWNGSDEDAFESSFDIGSDHYNDFENSIYETVSVGKNEKISFIDEDDAPHKRFWMPIPKRTSSSGYVVEASTIIPSWFRNQTSMPSTTAKIRLSVTVPALTKPVASITATRDEETPTTLGISVTVNSFKDDEIRSITVVDGNGNPLGSTSSTIVIPTSGQIVQPFVTQGVTTGSITAKVVVIGLGGASAEASVVIPVAFFTMDVQRGGKEIAFGSSAIDSDAQASEHGIFNCFMDAKFHNRAMINDELLLTGLSGVNGTEGIVIGDWKFCWGSVSTDTSKASGSGTFAAPYYVDVTSSAKLQFGGTPYAYSQVQGGWTGTRWSHTSMVENADGTYSPKIRLFASAKNSTATLIRWFAIGKKGVSINGLQN